jgi:GNAT superfamily N-acetyltransferase
VRVDVRAVPAHLSPARDLIEAMVAELEPLYGRIDGPAAPSATPEDFAAPHGIFVVLYDAGGPVAGGGVKRWDEGIAEIKRMYVVPAARGRGHGRTLLEALEHAARTLGYTHARLDTGPEQPGARGLYESAGYVAIDDYNANPHASYWGEKRISDRR